MELSWGRGPCRRSVEASGQLFLFARCRVAPAPPITGISSKPSLIVDTPILGSRGATRARSSSIPSVAVGVHRPQIAACVEASQRPTDESAILDPELSGFASTRADGMGVTLSTRRRLRASTVSGCTGVTKVCSLTFTVAVHQASRQTAQLLKARRSGNVWQTASSSDAAAPSALIAERTIGEVCLDDSSAPCVNDCSKLGAMA
jgi:hypothetical protein